MSCLVLKHRVCRTYREEHLLDFGFGTRLVHFIFISVVSFVKTSLQVDEDGESYWVFESRDVRMPFILTLPLSIVISLLGRQTLWIQGMFFQQFAFHL